ENDITSKGLHRSYNARVVRRDDDAIWRPGLASALIDVLHEGFACLTQQRLAGESGRSITGGDDDCSLHRDLHVHICLGYGVNCGVLCNFRQAIFSGCMLSLRGFLPVLIRWTEPWRIASSPAFS